MIYRCCTQNGSSPVIREYVAGGSAAMAAGTLVVMGADVVSAAADEAVAALGWLDGDVSAAEAVAGKSVNVMEANDNTLVEMPWSGTLPSNPLGDYYGLDVTDGVQTVNMSDVTNKLFKLIKVTRNGTASGHTAGDQRCIVMIPSAMAQGIIEA